MRTPAIMYRFLKWPVIRLLIAFLILPVRFSIAQPPPPRPIKITQVLGLSFGAFYHGPSGGTISVNSSGTRSTTGSVVMMDMGYSYSPAIFNVTGNAGTRIILTLGPDVNLTGSNGGSLVLHLTDTSPPSGFVLNSSYPTATQFRIGGSLVVGNAGANPPGAYNGTFTIIFNHQ